MSKKTKLVDLPAKMFAGQPVRELMGGHDEEYDCHYQWNRRSACQAGKIAHCVIRIGDGDTHAAQNS